MVIELTVLTSMSFKALFKFGICTIHAPTIAPIMDSFALFLYCLHNGSNTPLLFQPKIKRAPFSCLLRGWKLSAI